jgi:hypothetical protein
LVVHTFCNCPVYPTPNTARCFYTSLVPYKTQKPLHCFNLCLLPNYKCHTLADPLTTRLAYHRYRQRHCVLSALPALHGSSHLGGFDLLLLNVVLVGGISGREFGSSYIWSRSAAPSHWVPTLCCHSLRLLHNHQHHQYPGWSPPPHQQNSAHNF